MIAHLRGTIGKIAPGDAVVDIGGVGYRVRMPVNDWDEVHDGASVHLLTVSYIREDRFDLYGFLHAGTRMLFEAFIDLNGIGPRMALELCAVPRALLTRAINEKDASILSSIKGIGRKTADKLLVDLSSLAERHPEAFFSETTAMGARYDRDTVAALAQLGFATQDILRVLESLPHDLATTEERVAAALRLL
jgi:holliday junction DNA helicase RuvA